MKCSQCQHPLEDNAAFCTECGTSQPTDRTCAHCGQVVKASEKFCAFCGKPPELICSRCGGTLQASQKFCKSCGQKVQGQAARHTCPTCRALVEENSSFCTECGKSILDESSPLSATTQCTEGPKGDKLKEKDKEDTKPSTEAERFTRHEYDEGKEKELVNLADPEAMDPSLKGESDHVQASSDPEQAPIGSIQVTSDPVQASSGPIQASSGPVQASSGPVQASSGPIQASSGPVQVSSGPVQVSSGPVQASSDTVQASSDPVQEPCDPVKISDDPAHVSNDPIQLFSDPIQASSYSSQPSGEPTLTSDEPAQASNELVQTSGEPTQTSEQPAQASNELVQTSGEPAQAFEEPAQASEEPAQISEEPAQASAQASEEPAQTSNELVQTSGDPTQTFEQPAQASNELVQTSGEPAQASEEPAQTSEEPAQTFEEPVQTSEEPAQTSEEPAQTSEEPAQTSEEPVHASEEPAQASEEPAQISEEPAQASAQASEEPAQTSEEPAQTSEEPAHASGEPAQASGEPAQASEEPAQTSGEPAQTYNEPVQVSNDEPQIFNDPRETASNPAPLSTDGLQACSEQLTTPEAHKSIVQSGTDPLQTSSTQHPTADSGQYAGAAAAAAAGPAVNSSGHTASDGNAEGEDGDSGDSKSQDEENQEVEEAEEDDKSSQKGSQQGGAARKRGRGRRRGKTRDKRKQERKQKQAAVEKLAARVMFHVVISNNFKQTKANNHKVFLSWAPDSAKPSPHARIEMHHTVRAGESGILYEAEVEASQLPNSTVIKYKYCVELDGELEWEKLYFIRGNKNKDKVCRELRLPGPQILQKGPWHVFDWMAYPSGMKSVFDPVKRYIPGATSSKDIFVRDLKLSCCLFLPTPVMVISALSSQVIKAESTAKSMLHLISVLGQKAVSDADVTVHFMGDCIREFLLVPLMEYLTTAIHEGKPTVVLATFLLCLFDLAKLCPSYDNRNRIFRALLIKPDLDKKICPEIQQLHHHFPVLMNTRGALQSKCVEWIIGNTLENSTYWIYTLPLMHLISGQCQQFLTPYPDEKHRSSAWWGSSKVEIRIEVFKYGTQGNWYPEKDNEVYKNLSAALVADPLMLRTFVAMMNLDQVLSIFREGLPAEIVMASLFFHLHTTPNLCINRNKEIVQILRNTAEVVGVLIRSKSQVTPQDKKHYTMLGAICEDLLKEVAETRFYDNAVVQAVVLLQLSILTMLARPDQCAVGRNEAIKNNLVYYMEQWLTKFHCVAVEHWEAFVKFIEECLKTSEEIPNHEIADSLKQYFLQTVKHRLNQLDPMMRLTACVKLMGRDDSLSSLVVEDMHLYLEQAFAQEQDRIEHFLRSDLTILQIPVSELFKAKCSRKVIQKREDYLKLVFMWKPMVIFLRSYSRQNYKHTWVSQEVADKIEETHIFLQKLHDKVIDGRVSVSDLQWLVHDDHRSKVCEVLQAVGYEANTAHSALRLRQKELEKFQNVASDVACLLRLCQEFITTDDAKTELENFREKTGNLDKKKITDICKNPAKPGHVQAEDYMPTVHMEAVPERFREYLPKVAQRLKSAVFRNMLRRCAGAMNISPDSGFWEVLVSVWHEAEGEWTHACGAMREGRITVAEAETLFSMIEKNERWKEKCKEEMKHMSEDAPDDWVNNRMLQFQCLSRMNTQRQAADILCRIKEEFSFSGDVENIRNFQEVDVTQPIGQIDTSVVGTSQALQDIDEESVQHFRQFGSQECSTFVNWVKETMAGDGMKELKVFVDLALNYVGDEPREMDKIRNLRAVITGYASLIFQSNTDTNFLDRCSEVARNIQADKDLPAKLASTVCLVEWFDTIHKFHGAVEKTAMAQVDSITSRGILKVGRLQQPTHTGRGLDVSDVMCLEVPADSKAEDAGRSYSYQDLLDLQSRLMLVVGPEDQDHTNVDRFISVMDSVVRLVRTYIQLCQDGCLLFLNWTVKFFFDQTRGVCSIIEFVHENKVRRLKGQQNTQHEQTLEHYMAMVAHFLDSSRDMWLDYVAQTRRNYEELNVYTMDQLVFLQEQLADKKQGDLAPQVFPLLSLLHTHSSPQALQEAIEQAGDMMHKDESQEDEAVDEQAQKMAKFIQNMIDNGFSRQLAVRALKDGLDPSDADEGITWCMDHGDDDEEEDDNCDTAGDDNNNNASPATHLHSVLIDHVWLVWQESDKMIKLDRDRYTEEEEEDLGITWCMDHGDDDEEEEDNCDTAGELRNNLSASSTILNASMMEGTIATALQLLDALSEDPLSLDTVKTHLEETWTLFLERVTFSGEDYLSLKHIGCVLTALTQQGTLEVDRRLPPPMNRGTPNLIVCPKSEVLRAVTSLYMFIREAPLPLPDEVLLCTLQTTAEQISMFCQRAFSAKPSQMQKIHCLAFADHLHYEVCQFADQELKEFINTTKHPYQLVVVCTAENEFNSGLTASLERYSRPAPIHASDTQALTSYLCSKFTVPENHTPSPAARVDPDRLCVRVVKSARSGMGKTLYVKRLISQLKTLLEEEETEEDDSDEESMLSLESMKEETSTHVTVPLYEKYVSSHHVAHTLLHRLPPEGETHQARIIHLDIAYEVQEGVDHLLYSLLVLGCVSDINGRVWRRSSSDLYLLEAMPLLEHSQSKEQKIMHEIFSILPSTRCFSPLESLAALKGITERADNGHKVLFDKEEYRSTVFQRAFHYLKPLGRGRDPEVFRPQPERAENQSACLETLIKHCGVKNPSWSELFHFVSFLNKQLEDFEHSIFCSAQCAEDLPGFPAFVLKFLIHMSRDFATRSLDMSEEILPVLKQEQEDDEQSVEGIKQFQMRRTWESSPHPYIFFNPDKTSMTFLGFTVDPSTGNLINQTGNVLEAAIMKRSLYHILAGNGVPLSEDFDSLDRGDKLLRLYQVMGVPEEERRNKKGIVVDPDDTYELTTDNAKKIMAIYMRFRCNIPVIVMGETGCGKTRLVQFLCALQTPKTKNPKTMVIMKVHGGTTSEDIHKKVQEAEVLAMEAKQSLKQAERPLYTVLFFDEANTTEAIGAIKEVMCDTAMKGTPIQLHNNLKMVAACNPYRKHSPAVIQRLEKAGLGYHVSAEKTCDKLGRVPMRQLVYRVQPLPQSMLPLVWDFGQLTSEVEHMYIAQMVRRCERTQLFGDLSQPELDTLCRVLVKCQAFMRELKDECSFVSLRDADRALRMTSWFLKQTLLLTKIQEGLAHRLRTSNITASLVLALAVCYRAGLPDKKKFEDAVTSVFERQFPIRGPDNFRNILDSCQDVLLEDVKLGEKIAKNQALKENVFMMVVCVELRIPLFLVGKPGSSKSLAKTIVADAMQGQQKGSGRIFNTLKEVQMMSFQCSPLATADSIVNTFRQCAQLQKDKDRDKFVAVAVLDEVGLAEDSPHMPLKALHPLLEDGYEVQEDLLNNKAEEEQQHAKNGEEELTLGEDVGILRGLSDDDDHELQEEEHEETDDEEQYPEPGEELESVEEQDSENESVQEDPGVEGKRTRLEKVAFIGISNWALDPAKMNRGILVQRDVPDKGELIKTAISICQSGSRDTENHVKSLVHKLAEAYLKIFQHNLCQREFFGLRDFYSLVKMVHTTAAQKGRKVTKAELQAAVRRNFGGLDFDPVDTFEHHLEKGDTHGKPVKEDVDSSYSALLRTALSGEGDCGENRYLLLLTENYGGLHILTDTLLTGHPVEPIFGSSFPRDQEYTQICRNINRIKICMETGKTVILLNLDNLYESLYDALNQYYSYLSNARYVDLGLGTHRVKCKVDTKFRLIVVAEKQTVYDKFPIPLINRLEKHFLTVNSLLTQEQHRLEKQLQLWVTEVVHQGCEADQLEVNDMWIGYHCDTVASLLLTAWEKHLTPSQTLTPDLEEKILQECKRALLWCATPDAVIRARDDWCSQLYFQEQQHDSLAHYLQEALDNRELCLMAQVTTHSKLLTEVERAELERQLRDYSFTLLTLQAFHTEQQFRHRLSLFLEEGERGRKVVLIQCERGQVNQSLLQCAQYCVQSLWARRHHHHHHVIFLVQLPRVTATPFSGYIGGQWRCLHMDDLRSHPCRLPPVSQLQAVSPAHLLASALGKPAAETSEERDDNDDDDTHAAEGLSLDLVRHVLAACVQSAVARIRDGTTTTSRATDRIAILLQWFDNKEEEAFLRGVLRMVCDAMKKKEAESEEHLCPADWLTRRAARPDSIRKAGTMRRAWLQYVEGEVVPMLAGVVSYLDTNHNLDLLPTAGEGREGDGADTWLLDMWLHVLHHPDLGQLLNDHLLSLTGQPGPLKEVPCHSMFLMQETASPALPFSWILWEVVEAYLAHPTAPGEEESVVEAVERCALGQYLGKAVTTDQKAEDFVMRYLADLVHHCFRPQPAQHQLLVQCVKQAMDQVGVAVQAYRLSHVLVSMHQVMVSVTPRLQALLDMTACHPQALQALHDHHNDQQLTQPELVEDILLLKILAEELTPQKNQLNTDEGIRGWLDHFNTLAPVLSGVLEDADAYCTGGWDQQGDIRDRPARQGKQRFLYGPWCRENIASVRCLWTRVMTVKLFIDYMSPLGRGTGNVRVEPLNYNLLWTLLKDSTTMDKTLCAVDDYIKRANSQMVKHLLGDVGKCFHCAIKLDGPPTELPCGHRVCNKCYTQEVRTQHSCPECHQAVPDSFQPDSSGCCDREKVEKLVSYQQQTSAFLMAVISQLVFGGNTPPEPCTMEHVFSYTIRRVEGVTTIQTQQLTLREDQMDPSPVLRSFILRLLLKHSEEEVSEYISQFLEDARLTIKEHVGGDDRQSSSVLRELSLLIIHCVENLEHEREVKGVAEKTISDSLAERCSRIKDSMHQVRLKLESNPLELSTLMALGQVRYALSMCASLLHSHLLQAAEGGCIDMAFKDLLMEAAIICTMGNSQWPKLFLVKQLCREFGLQAYMTLVQHVETQPVLRWLKLDEVQQTEAVSDRYLLCGPVYQSVREEITSQLRNLDEQRLSSLQDCGLSREKQQYLVMLALHREVTMAVAGSDQHTRVSLAERAVRLVQSGTYPVDKDFALSVVRNELGVAESWLHVGDPHSLAEQSLVCILTHFWLALRSCQQRRHLLETFLTLIQQPDVMRNSCLPTMPQDNLDDIIRAMNIDHRKTMQDYNAGVEIPKLWECPRGHRYTIGDCGNPNAQGSCPECGVAIGGAKYHVPAAGNQMAQIRDRTQPGHILGSAKDRSDEAIPERGMSAAVCSLVRFLTHAALYLSAAQPDQASSVSSLIHPAVQEDDVMDFLWAHLMKDLQVVQRALGRSSDDVYLLLHHLCHQMAVLPTVHFWGHLLGTKLDRENWEKAFTDRYIQPVLQQADATIRTGYDLLLADTAQGQKQLLNVVFEVGEQEPGPEGQEPIQYTPAAWKYRLRITVDQFFTQFQLQDHRQQDALPVLKLFIQQSHYLRALHYVPDILSLQRHLLHQLHHRFSRVEAASTPIRDLMHTREGPDLQKLMTVFSKAWDIVKNFLVNYRCCTEEGVAVCLPEEFQRVQVGEDSPVAMVLPDSQGPGLCAYLLIHYLLVQHNHFLTLYCPNTAQAYEELPEVPLSAVGRRHLVSYSPETDLLPLVLVHCNYSLHLGHSDAATSPTQLHYDFHGFELQLRNTLLLSKSRVQRQQNTAMQIETLTYCADSTTSRFFHTLRQRIPQEPLDTQVQRQIVAELGENLEDLCHSIDGLNTTLTFLLSVSVSAELPLHRFMMETLRMRDTDVVHSRRAQQLCQVKHVQCLWLLLCSQRARILALNNQEAFDQQGQEVRHQLTDDQRTEMTTVLQRLSPDRVDLVLSHIYQCVMMDLIPRCQDPESARPDNYSLTWLLNESLESPVYTQPPGKQAQDDLCAHDLDNFPGSILASQAIPCWLLVLNHLTARQK